MANTIYPKYKAALLAPSGISPTPTLDLLTSNVKIALIDTGAYTYDGGHDEFLSDIPSGAIIAETGNLDGKAVGADGSFDSNDPTFTAVTGVQCEALVIYIDTGDDSSSRLVAYQDTGIAGMPITPNGGDINITVDVDGWFTL
jgi:hypothetical protein